MTPATTPPTTGDAQEAPTEPQATGRPADGPRPPLVVDRPKPLRDDDAVRHSLSVLGRNLRFIGFGWVIHHQLEHESVQLRFR